MSLDTVKRRICCDGSHCAQAVSLPLTLPVRASGTQRSKDAPSSAAGWVFVTRADEVRHYCPHCGRKLLTEQAG